MLDRRYLRCVSLREPPPRGSYLSALPAVRWLAAGNPLAFPADITFFVGENGTGKSTLLEGIALASGFNAEGGSRNARFSTADDFSDLCRYLTLTRGGQPTDGFFLRAESFYNVATYTDEVNCGDPRAMQAYGGKSLHDQSHGESFLALMQNRFGGGGLYLLDEPEAALSPTRLMSLLVLLHDLTKQASQFIIATHSPILMAYPGAAIWQFSEQGIARTAYRATEHYQLTKRFLDDPDRMLRYLFGEESED